MKTLFLKYFLFLLPLFLVIGGVEVALRTNPKIGTQNYYLEKKEKLEAQLPEIQCLVLGSSHALHAIQEARFPVPTYNLASFSQSLIIDRQLFEKYVDKMPNLKYLVLSLSYFSLQYKVAGTIENWRNFWYEKVFDIPGDGDFKDKLDIRRFSLYHLLGKEYSESYLKKQFGWEKEALETPTTPVATPATEGLVDFHSQEHIDRHHASMKKEYYEENEAALKRIVQLAADHQIKTILITPPVHPTYQKLLKVENTSLTQTLLEKLKAENPETLSYLNYTGDTRFEDHDFFDADHLNDSGAQKLTQDLTDRINSSRSFRLPAASKN